MKPHSLQEETRQRCIKEKLKFREIIVQCVNAISFLFEVKKKSRQKENFIVKTQDLERPIVIVGQRIRLIGMSSTPS